MTLALAVGLGMYALTLCAQMAPVVVFLHIATSKHPRSLLRPSYAANFILLQLVAVETAYYHSAVNYSSLGYGDIVMSPHWHLLGPLEAIDGIMMFGLSSALFFALMARLIDRRLRANQMDG